MGVKEQIIVQLRASAQWKTVLCCHLLEVLWKLKGLETEKVNVLPVAVQSFPLIHTYSLSEIICTVLDMYSYDCHDN